MEQVITTIAQCAHDNNDDTDNEIVYIAISYDAFGYLVNETEFLGNVDYVAANLLPLGYNIVTIDYYWFTDADETTFLDKYGRPQPSPTRWPSSRDGTGFTAVADYVHKKGLLFGIHTMRGISGVAVDRKSPVFGTNATAADVYDSKNECGWSFSFSKFYSVNVSKAEGVAFYNSLYNQYASWGVDFIKNDCVYGNYVFDQIQAVSTAIDQSGRPMLYSLSPGSDNPKMASQVTPLTNMYRVTGDTWDSWSGLRDHFAAAVSTQPFIGVRGRYGGLSSPDLDMLPLGWIGGTGKNRFSELTKDEQQTMMSLWNIFRSPLMYGGDLRVFDAYPYSLITNTEALEINSFSTNNTYVKTPVDSPIWIADSTLGSVGFVAVFNLQDRSQNVSFSVSNVTWRGNTCAVRSIWAGIDIGTFSFISVELKAHASALFSLSQCS